MNVSSSGSGSVNDSWRVSGSSCVSGSGSGVRVEGIDGKNGNNKEIIVREQSGTRSCTSFINFP